MTYYSTKTYGHNIGLSAVFRQPNADHSHCHLLHGYSLAFKFTFGCKDLDNKNWAVDFGGLKPLKKWLENNFDHKLVLDENDPHLEKFKELEELDLAEIRIFDGVGAEKFAKHAFDAADDQEKAFWRRTLEDQEQKKGDFRRAVGMLEKSGALTATIERAREYGAKARNALEPFPDSKYKNALTEAVEFAIHRSY